jgi:hypothetical protein
MQTGKWKGGGEVAAKRSDEGRLMAMRRLATVFTIYGLGIRVPPMLSISGTTAKGVNF